MDKMKKALMIVAIVTLVAIAGSMIYYFVFFKPGIAKAEIRLQEQKFQQEKDIQTQDSLDKALKEKQATVNSIAKESALSSCLDQAYKDYSSAFDKAKSNLLESFKMINDLYSKNWDTECAKLNLSPGSPLPTYIADRLKKELDDQTAKAIEYSDKAFAKIEKDYENAKADCYKLYGK